jgi:hypothetical protein
MSGGSAKVLSTDSLRDLQIALIRFRDEAMSSMSNTKLEIIRVRDALNSRRLYCENELSRLQHALTSARQEEVTRIQGLVQKMKQELVSVNEHIRRVEASIQAYERETYRFTSMLEEKVPSAAALLGEFIFRLERYEASTLITGRSSSGEGSTYSNDKDNMDPTSTAIHDSVQSNNLNIKQEGIVANRVKDGLVSFQRNFVANDSTDEIDIEASIDNQRAASTEPIGSDPDLSDSETEIIQGLFGGQELLSQLPNVHPAKKISLIYEARLALDAIRRGEPSKDIHIGKEISRTHRGHKRSQTLVEVDIETKNEIIQHKGGDYSKKEKLVGEDLQQWYNTEKYNTQMRFDDQGNKLPPKVLVFHFTQLPVNPKLIQWLEKRGVTVRIGSR